MRKSRVGEDWRNGLGQVPGVFFEAWDTQEMGALVISRIQVLSISSGQCRSEQLSLSWPVDSPLAAQQRRRTHWCECSRPARHQRHMLTDNDLKAISGLFYFIILAG